MINYLYKVFAHFLFGLSINLIIFYLVSKTEDMSKKLISFNTLVANIKEITVLFSFFAIFDIVWNFYFSMSLINTSIIYIFIICFFGDVVSVLFILGIIALAYSFIIPLYQAVIINIFNIILAFIVFRFARYAKSKKILVYKFSLLLLLLLAYI